MTTIHQSARLATGRIIPLLLVCSVAGAGAATIIQTRNFAFTPSGNQTLLFDEFDTMGGTRTLTSVMITTSLTKSGGSLFVDNDSGVAASGSISQAVTINLSASGASLINDQFDGLIGSNLTATSFYSVSLGADDGDGSQYQSGGPDWGGTSFDSATVSQSEYAGSINTYKGSGTTFSILVSGTQNTDTSALSGVAGAFSPATAAGYVTVTYGFTPAPVPEPSPWMMLGLGLGGSMFYRRRSA